MRKIERQPNGKLTTIAHTFYSSTSVCGPEPDPWPETNSEFDLLSEADKMIIFTRMVNGNCMAINAIATQGNVLIQARGGTGDMIQDFLESPAILFKFFIP